MIILKLIKTTEKKKYWQKFNIIIKKCIWYKVQYIKFVILYSLHSSFYYSYTFKYCVSIVVSIEFILHWNWHLQNEKLLIKIKLVREWK